MTIPETTALLRKRLVNLCVLDGLARSQNKKCVQEILDILTPEFLDEVDRLCIPTPDPLAGENPDQKATAPVADESATDQLEPVVDILAALKKALGAIEKPQEAPDA